MEQPLLSILIPCYNHEDFITDTIQSIWNQHLINIEIIVIDDGSKDKSYEVLKELQSNSPVSMQIYTQKNSGITKTLNRCLSKAKGKYITLIASDDQYFPDTLPILLKSIQKDTQTKIIYTNGREYKDGQLFKKMHHQKIIDMLSLTTSQIEKKLRTEVPRPLLTQCAIYEKSLLTDIGGWDENVELDDWPLNIKIFRYLTLNNFCHEFINIDLVKYRFHENNLHKNSYKMYLMVEEVILKYTPKNLQQEFLAKEMYELGKGILKTSHPLFGTKLLFKSLYLKFNILKLFNILRLVIKYNLKYLLSKKIP